MTLAIWVQRVVSPILYQIITIHIKPNATVYSLFAAIASFTPWPVFGDEAQTKDSTFAKATAEIVIKSSRKRLKVLLHLVDYPPLQTTHRSLLPYSVTYAGVGNTFNHTYGVVRLRLIDFSPQSWEVRDLLAIAKGVTHIAFALTSNARASMGLVESVTRGAHRQRHVVLVKLSLEEEYPKTVGDDRRASYLARGYQLV